ncbi:MAG: hypothetical protein WD225_04780 [Ilumatobacteraceae bacterium]
MPVRSAAATIIVAAVAASTISALPVVPSTARTAGAAPSIGVPTRVLDTRDGTGGTVGPIPPGSTLRLDVPATRGTGAIALNLTATDAAAPGYVVAWPCDDERPPTSVLNVDPGRAVPNTVVVGRSSTGVCIETSASMHLVGDLMAAFGDGDVVPIRPERLLDTRAAGGRFSAGETRPVSVPESTFVAVNVTAVEPTDDGFVTVAPCAAVGASSPPTTSSVNFRAGETVAATTVVAASMGEVCVHASTDTHVLLDLAARGVDGPVRVGTPARLLDTRADMGGPADHDATLSVRVAGRGGVPNDVTAALVTATVVGDAHGHVTAWPCDTPAPGTSLLNTWPGAVRANTGVVGVSTDHGELCLRPWTTDGSPVDLIVDVTGWIDGDIVRDPPPEPAPGQPGPSPTGRFETLPPGAALPSGSTCATRVRPVAEIRPANAGPNATRGTAPNERYPRVDGDFVGTTDEIIQWAACKWGIDEGIVRAQIVKESWWNQSAIGDNGESYGLGQVRVPYHQEAFAFDDAIRSSAYNLDYTYAGWRSCFEGNETWLNDVERGAWYEAGDMWGCLGVWFTGRWWVPDVTVYLDGGPTDGYGDLGVREHLERRTWEDPDFVSGG